MAFEVEDGTGKPNAVSLLAVADADTYHLARGNAAWAALTNDQKQQALIRASAWVNANYRGRWAGTSLRGRGQAFDWPRLNATDAAGNTIDDDEIPVELQQAVAEAALREAASPGVLTPDIGTPTQLVKRVMKKVGPLETETEYENASGGVASVPIVTLIDQLLAGLLVGGDDSRVAFIRRA